MSDTPAAGPAVARPQTVARVTTGQVWRAVERATFAVISYVTPTGSPRSSGVMHVAADRRLFVAVGPDSWKARHIHDGDEVAVTVLVRRGGLLSLVAPIPPATISCHARATVHPAGTAGGLAIPAKLASRLPADRRDVCLLELAPEGQFLTYGVGVSLWDMAKADRARAHVPV